MFDTRRNAFARTSILACVLAMAHVAPARADGDAGGTAPAWAAEVDALMAEEMRTQGIPGAQIAIAQNGRVAYAKAYGVADVESRRPVTDATLFQVGSVPKLFTGVVLAELATEGTVDLKAPIRRYVTELDGRRVGTVTTHQLLTHSAGWFDHAQPFGRTDPAAMGDVLKQAPDSWVFAAPGRVYSYSNNSLAMAGYVAERATGTPFAQLVEQRILRPVTRDHATYDPLMAMTRDFSQGHVEAEGRVVIQRPMPVNSAEVGAGFLYVTASGLARMGIAMMSGGVLDGTRVFKRSSLDTVTGRYIPIPGSLDNHAGYGLHVDRVDGERVWRKSGTVNGFASELSMWPDRELAVATSINRMSSPVPIRVNVAVARLVLGQPTPAAVALPPESNGTAAERAAVAGRYRFRADRSVEIVERDGALELVNRLGRFPVRFRGPDRLVVDAPAPAPTEYIILRDGTGAVEFLHGGSRAGVRERP